jgi:hypothetical protein
MLLNLLKRIPTRGNLFLPVRLLVWADGPGTVMQADSAARAELQGAPKTKVTAAKKYTKIPLGQAQGDAYLLFRCLPLICNCFGCEPVPQDLFCPSAGTGRYRQMPVCRPGLACRPSSNKQSHSS